MIRKTTIATLLSCLLPLTLSFGAYYIKVFQGEDKATASAVLYDLLSKNINNCKMNRVVKDYRVLCGPFKSIEEARKEVSKIRDLGYMSVIVKSSRSGYTEKRKSNFTRKRTTKSRRERIRKAIIDTFLGKKLRQAYYSLNSGELERAEVLAYSLLNTKLRNDALFILGLVNMKRGDDAQACHFMSKIPEGFKQELKDLKELVCIKEAIAKDTKPERHKMQGKSLKEALNLYSAKRYDEAVSLLKKVLKEEPTNIEALLLLGDVYMTLRKYAEAYSYYSMAYSLNPNSIRAIKGLMYASVGLGRYEDAYRYAKILEDKGVSVADIPRIKALFFAKKAEKLISAGDLEEAYMYLQKAQSLYDKEPYIYLLLGDVFFNRKEYADAYRYYAEAYRLRPDFDSMLKILYALAELGNYDLANEFLRDIDVEELTSSQKQKLRNFYRYLYIKASSHFLKLKDYQKTFTVAKEGLVMFPDEITLLSNLAWACLNLDRLDCAEENFMKVLRIQRDNYDAIYGLALLYARVQDRERAEKYASLLARKGSRDAYIKVADIYAILGDYETAKQFVDRAKRAKRVETPSKGGLSNRKVHEEESSFQDSVSTDSFFFNPFITNSPTYEDYKKKDTGEERTSSKRVSIKPISFSRRDDIPDIERRIEEAIKKQHTDFIEIYTKVSTKSGRKGLDRLATYSINIAGEKKIHRNVFVTTHNRILLLDSGGRPSISLTGGLVPPGTERINSYFAGLEPSVGLRVGKPDKYLAMGIGLTPIGNPTFPPTPTFAVDIRFGEDAYLVKLSLKRDSVRNSLLSYTGLVEKGSGIRWGRVVEQGGELTFQLGNGYRSSFLPIKAGYFYIKGKNTRSNSRVFWEIFPTVYMGKALLDENYLSLFFRYENYSKDDNLYFFGHGGYFSPQNFFLVGPRYTGYLRTKNLALRLNLLVGFLSYSTGVYRRNTIGLDTSAYFEYKLLESLSFTGAIGFRNSQEYNELAFILGLKYYFRGLIRPFRETLDTFDRRLFY